MTALSLLIAGLAHASPALAELETQGLAALAGTDRCLDVRVSATQAVTVPLLGTDTEVVTLTGRLDHGVWTGIQETVVADSDPSSRIFETGLLWVGDLGVGVVPGTPIDPEDAPYEAVFEPSDQLRWRDGHLQRHTPGLGWVSDLTVVDGRVVGMQMRLAGSESITWRLELAAGGEPVREHTQASFAYLGVAATLTQDLAYSTRPCAPG